MDKIKVVGNCNEMTITAFGNTYYADLEDFDENMKSGVENWKFQNTVIEVEQVLDKNSLMEAASIFLASIGINNHEEEYEVIYN